MDRTDRLAGGFAAALLLGGLTVGLLRLVIPDTITTVETAVPPDIIVLVVVGLLGLLAVVSLRDSATQPSHAEPLVTGHPPERPQEPPALVGEDFTTTVSNAAQAVRVRQVNPADTSPHHRLHTTAVSVVTRARGCSTIDAEARVTSGEWTIDPVARAFLSPTATYPRWFRILRWARPAVAYEHGVSQTITAIRSIAEADVPGYTSQTNRSASEAVEPPAEPHGVLGTLRAVFAAASSVTHRGNTLSTRPGETAATTARKTSPREAVETPENGADLGATDHAESTIGNADAASPADVEKPAVTDGEGPVARTEVTPRE